MELFYNWRDAVKCLYSLIVRNQPIAGVGVAVEKTANGCRINVTGVTAMSGSGTAKYAGSFQVKNISDDESLMLAVVNGANENAATCGIVFVGGQVIPVEMFSGEPDSDSGYVILTIESEGGDVGSAPNYLAGISLVSEIPKEYDNNVWVKIVALGSYAVKTTGEGSEQTSSLTVSQSWLNGDIYVTDRVV